MQNILLKKFISQLVPIFLIFIVGVTLTAQNLPRVVVTTDGELDDKDSFIRFLLYTNEYDVAGLIYSNSQWHLKGNGTIWMGEYIDEYAKVYDNLIVHDPNYPAPEYLKSLQRAGNLEDFGINGVGEGKNTPASDHIVDVLTDEDLRPVWLQAWGGLNNIAQALLQIKSLPIAAQKKAYGKARIYAIADQDSLRPWITDRFPDVIFVENSYQFWRVWAYHWDRKHPLENHESYTSEWLNKNIIQNHGALCARYKLARDFLPEGDTPAFLHNIPVGLRGIENLDWGGWGGRFELQFGNYWKDTKDKHDGDHNNELTKPAWRWMPDVNASFAARADWCVKENFDEANHDPVIILSHPEELAVRSGEVVKLDASRTSDPDGDELEFKWWHYGDVSTIGGDIVINNVNSPKAEFKVPEAKSGEMIHIVLTVRDNGVPSLVRYKRVVVTLSD